MTFLCFSLSCSISVNSSLAAHPQPGFWLALLPKCGICGNTWGDSAERSKGTNCSLSSRFHWLRLSSSTPGHDVSHSISLKGFSNAACPLLSRPTGSQGVPLPAQDSPASPVGFPDSICLTSSSKRLLGPARPLAIHRSKAERFINSIAQSHNLGGVTAAHKGP